MMLAITQATTTKEYFMIISGEKLLTALTALKPFISTEETRYYLCGVNFRIADKNLTLAATDGHRMATYKIAGVDSENVDVIISTEAVNWILKNITKKDIVTLTFDDIYINISFDVTSSKFTLVDGTFPDYQRVIPPVVGETIRFDAKYMKEIAAAVCKNSTKGKYESEIMTLHITDETTPIAIHSSDANLSMILMPMRGDTRHDDDRINQAIRLLQACHFHDSDDSIKNVKVNKIINLIRELLPEKETEAA